MTLFSRQNIAYAATGIVSVALSAVLYNNTIPSKPDGGDRIEIAHDQITVDLGDITPGSQAIGKANLVNISNKKVRVLRLMPSCGCLSVDVGNESIRPGESTVLSVVLNAPILSGPVSHRVEIVCDEPSAIASSVRFVGSVKGWARVEGDSFRLDKVAPGATVNSEFRIRSDEEWPVDKRSVTCDLPNCVVNIKDGGSADARSLLLHVQYSPAIGTPPGAITSTLTLNWLGKPERSIRFPITCSIVSGIQARPERLVLGCISKNEIGRYTIDVSLNGGIINIARNTISVHSSDPTVTTCNSEWLSDGILRVTGTITPTRPETTPVITKGGTTTVGLSYVTIECNNGATVLDSCKVPISWTHCP